MAKFVKKLQKKWGVKSAFQVIVILLVFSLAGFSTLYAHRLINSLLGTEPSTVFIIKLKVFIFLVMPVWAFLFFLWGTLLGQRKFVISFLKTKVKILTFGKLFKDM